MQACYFGPSEAPLFGVYHPPLASAQGKGALLCYPGPEEYMRVHWAFRNLAVALTKAGYHVFRFDYYGTGDSAGPTGEGHMQRWQANIQTAALEFGAIAGVKQLTLVGARLGAALLASAALALPRMSVDAWVLWDPVLRGGDYLSDLQNLQKLRLRRSRYALAALTHPEEPEILGYPLRPLLATSLRNFDLLSGELAVLPPKITLLWSEDTAPGPAASEDLLYERLRHNAPASQVRRVVVDEACRWRTQEVLEQALLPNKMLRQVTDAVTGTAVAVDAAPAAAATGVA